MQPSEEVFFGQLTDKIKQLQARNKRLEEEKALLINAVLHSETDDEYYPKKIIDQWYKEQALESEVKEKGQPQKQPPQRGEESAS